MRNVLLIIILTVCVVGSNAQQRADKTPPPQIMGTLKVDYKKIKQGTPFRMVRITDDMQLITKINDQEVAIPAKKAPAIIELTPENIEEFWFSQYINNRMLIHFKKKGYRLPLRGEVMNEAADYLGSVNDLFYLNKHTRSYIENTFAHISPRRLDKKRPERLRVEILKSPNPDAYMLGNGTLLITTGLLSAVDSADELMAVMVSEIAHYVLDHQVINVGKERGRVRSAKVWGSILTFIAAGVETILTENNEHYIPGGILLTASITEMFITEAAIQKLGMGYSDMQYFTADDIAINFLRMNNMNTTALSSALHKIKAFYTSENDSYALSKKGGYGNVDARIARLETPSDSIDPAFLRQMSDVTTFNAIVQYDSKNFEAAEQLAKKKIRHGCATDDDYLVLVQANMGYVDNPNNNERNLKLIRSAKSISESPNLGLYKQEIVLLMRLKRKAESFDAIEEYKTMLIEFRQQAINDDFAWANSEISWCDKMYRQTKSDIQD